MGLSLQGEKEDIQRVYLDSFLLGSQNSKKSFIL